MIRNIRVNTKTRDMVATVAKELKDRDVKLPMDHMVYYKRGAVGIDLSMPKNNQSKSSLVIETDNSNKSVLRILLDEMIGKLYLDNIIRVDVDNNTGDMKVVKPFFKSFGKIKRQIRKFYTDMQPENRVKEDSSPLCIVSCGNYGRQTVETYSDHEIKIIDT